MRQPFPHAAYDMRVNPITFDFCAYLAVISLVVRANGFDGFDLSVIATGYRNVTSREKAYSIKERIWRMSNLIIPLARLCPWVKNLHVVTHQGDSHEMGRLVIPKNYQYQTPTSSGYSPKQVINIFKSTKLTPLLFEPSEQALEIVQNKFRGRKLLTLSPRIANFDNLRNSKIDDWFDLCQLLQRKGYDVVILPDQDDVLSDRRYSKFDWEVYEPASFSMDLRLAMMKISAQNIISSGGLAGLANYSDSPYILCNILNSTSPVANERYFRDFVGIEVGSKYPWCSEHQHFYWGEFIPQRISEYFN